MREAEEKQEAMTPEEIEEMEKNIPEWKRNALVLADDEVKEEKAGILKGLKNRISNTDAAKTLKESEEYDKLQAARNDFRETMGKFKEGVENT
jgi:hypothetical protein